VYKPNQNRNINLHINYQEEHGDLNAKLAQPDLQC